MTTIDRKHSTLVSILFLACLTVALLPVPSGHAAQAPQGGTGQGQAQKAQPGQPQAPVGTGFTYQGQLKDGGNPANGQFDLQFKLFDAASGGAQVGNTVTVANQTVTGGLFTVVIDFGASAFGGQERWLEIAVRPTGGGTYTTLSPRQPLTAVPYAQSLATGSSGAVISGTVQGPALIVTNTLATGIKGVSTNSYGLSGFSTNDTGVYGTSTSGIGVYGTTNYIGVRGESLGNAAGVYGTSSQYVGVLGTSINSYAGVLGQSFSSGPGVSGLSVTSSGVRGESTSQHGGLFTNNSTTGYAALQGIASGTPGYGIYGEGGSIGVWGSTPNGTGVRGATTGGYGVHGYAVGNGWGVRGESPGGIGVYGLSTSTSGNSYGVLGENTTNGGSGVYGVNNANSTSAIGVAGVTTRGTAIYGQSSLHYAGYFQGSVAINGHLTKSSGTFKIDHPLDPANKYLYHSFVESPDMMNVYNGNISTDAKGEAIVALPDYFETLNRDFRYQLTIMGEQFAQARVSSKIRDNRFTIKTDKPNIEVSWQVTGIRQDPYAKSHPIVPEVDKTTEERGLYLHPTEWGQPESKGINYERMKQLEQTEQPQQPQPLP